MQPAEHVLVPVETTKKCLRNLAMAVASGSPALLEGPVGSGKTALVEHLALVLGLGQPPGLIKIQLGDQTDSKVCSTEVNAWSTLPQVLCPFPSHAGIVGDLSMHWGSWWVCVAAWKSDSGSHSGSLGPVGGYWLCSYGCGVHSGASVGAGRPLPARAWRWDQGSSLL